jgi:YVTN family beta-propeller protein
VLRFVPWILVSTLLLFYPHPSLGADIDVRIQQIVTFGGGGSPKTEFMPGAEMLVTVGVRVTRATSDPFVVRLRITGDGWHEIRTSEPLVGPGPRVVTFGGPQSRLRVSGAAGPGKVSLLVDVFSENESVSLMGRRHEYISVLCPEGRPTGTAARLAVGRMPFDMAVTPNGQYLYVTSQEDRKVTVIDVETQTVVTEIQDPETIGQPAGVAPSANGAEMIVADAALQAIHVIDADDHVLIDTIPLNPTGELGVVSPGDLLVNPLRNEAYVTDLRNRRIFVVHLPSQDVEHIFLFESPTDPPRGLNPLQLLLDPDLPRFVYVLCGGLSEVIKLDVVSGAIIDFFQIRDLFDLSSLWPVWSMALNPLTGEIYVVMNPGHFEETYPTMQSKIYAFQKNRLWVGGRDFFVGSSIWDLVVREDGLVYAIDSYRGEILVIDMGTETELYRCAIPARPGGRLLRADTSRNRLFVGNWAPGYADIVE